MKTLTKVNDGREVTRILHQHNIPIRNCNGSHRVARLPNGVCLTYHEHGRFGPGMACKITKVLRLAGLLVVVLGVLSQFGIL